MKKSSESFFPINTNIKGFNDYLNKEVLYIDMSYYKKDIVPCSEMLISEICYHQCPYGCLGLIDGICRWRDKIYEYNCLKEDYIYKPSFLSGVLEIEVDKIKTIYIPRIKAIRLEKMLFREYYFLRELDYDHIKQIDFLKSLMPRKKDGAP